MLRTLAAGVVLSWFGLAAAETRVHTRERGAAPEGGGLAFGALTPGTRLDRVEVTLRTGPADVRATAVLSLSTSQKDQDAALEMDVPAGAQVTFLGLTMGGERRIAHLESSADAREQYENIVAGIEDPALLEVVSSTTETDKLRLRVFPLTRGKSARVEVIMTLPQASKFVLDPGKRAIPRVDIDRDGVQASWRGVASARAVTMSTSLTPGELPAELEDRVTVTQSLFIDRPPVVEQPDRIRRDPRIVRRERGAFRISQRCLENPLCGEE